MAAAWQSAHVDRIATKPWRDDARPADPCIHVLVEGDAPVPLANGLARFRVPHRLLDVGTLDDGVTAAWVLLSGIVACTIAGEAADRLCRHFEDCGTLVIRIPPSDEASSAGASTVAAATVAAWAGTLGGLLDRMSTAASPAA